MFKGDMVNEYGKEMYDKGYKYGSTMGAYYFRIDSAKRLLSMTESSVEEIAWICDLTPFEVVKLKELI